MSTKLDVPFLDYSRKELKKQFAYYIGTCFDEAELDELTDLAMEEIDWNNPVVMHKGYSWLAKNYLDRRRICCNN